MSTRISVFPSAQRGQGLVFVWNAGLNIPARFAHCVAEGVRTAAQTGGLGLPLTDLVVSVEDESYHEADSNAAAFKETAEKATAKALRQVQPVLLEAVASVTITAAEQFAGAVRGSVNSNRGE
jgi:translation elongation factor EF-G